MLCIIWIYYIDGPGFYKTKIIGDVSRDDERVITSFLFTGGRAKKINSNTKMLNEIFLKSIDKINELNPDHVFIAGDVIACESYNPFNETPRDFNKEKALFNKCYDQIVEDLQKINAEVLIAPGNHDVYNVYGEEVYKKKIGKLFFSVKEGDVRYVLLNSNKSERTNIFIPETWHVADSIRGEQLDFLKKGFSGEWTENSIFLFIHHDPFTIPNWQDEVQPLINNSNCRVVFSGTRQGSMRYNEIDGISYFDGGINEKGMIPTYYVLTTLYNNKIKFTLYLVYPDTLKGKFLMLENLLCRYYNKYI